MSVLTRGAAAELAALDYLQKQGLSLVAHNFRSRFGEIDLIMRESNCYVFVEVRFRQQGLAAAAWSITPAKQRKLVAAANYFLLKLGYQPACRFDAVILDEQGHLEWLKNIIQF